MRLSLLCQIFYQNEEGELPGTKAEFYEIFTRYFYEWKPELVPDVINSYQLKKELHEALGKLALAGINSDLKFRLKRSLAVEEMGEKLFKLAYDLGWLNQVDRDAVNDEDVYAFFHPNFQEYFAALIIDDWHYFLNHVPNNPEEGIYRIFEPQWKEVMLLWIGRKNVEKEQKESFLSTLIDLSDNIAAAIMFRTSLLWIAVTAALFGVANVLSCLSTAIIVIIFTMINLIFWQLY
ncbi:MAG: hypothetical protein V7K14_23890 [Nostoc sp.]|uniref:NACHT domain-containing protein n=1 Tax=Nostoc sp. TaxID=1180 RepID=UPI002FFCAE9D